MDENKNPGIVYEAMILKCSHFERTAEVTSERELNITFIQKNVLNDIKTQLSCELSAEVAPRNNAFTLKVTYVGIYRQDTDNPNMSLETFMSLHAPAHIFPYLREYISSTTVRAGLPVVILPPMNMHNIDKEYVVED